MIPDQRDTSNQFTVRFDHNFSATQHFSAYYYFNDDDNPVPFSNFQAAGANVPGFGAVTQDPSPAVEHSPHFYDWLDGGQRVSVQLFPRGARQPQPSHQHLAEFA